MKLRGDLADSALWAIVASTVRPLPGRSAPAPVSLPQFGSRTHHPASSQIAHNPRATPKLPPQDIEPQRFHRLASGRDRLMARLDLHGHSQDSARAVLTGFLLSVHAQGSRSVLVITGKGVLGDGVLRRRVPEWLATAPLRPLIAGVSEAHSRHGGQGALYVALKRRD